MSMDFRKRANSTQMKYRKWQKVIDPLLKFTRSSSGLSYHLDFINQLQKIIGKGYQLNLNIPLTLSGAHDNCLKTVYKTNDDQVGTISFFPNMMRIIFDSEIEKEVNKRTQALCNRQSQFKMFMQQKQQSGSANQTVPFVVVKQKGKLTDQFVQPESNSLILSKDEYKKIVNIESHQILQSFVYGNSSTSSITRFFYYPKKQTLSIAYKIDNHQNALKKKFFKSLWRIQASNEHSFTFIKIMHQSKSFTNQTMNLVKCLETARKCGVQKIVTDWVIDPANRYVLVDVKQVKFENAPILQKTSMDLNNVLAVITCSVCQQKFQNSQINKLITHKLIWQFFEHLRKRKVELSFKPNYKYSSNTARVCDLCYMLVVSESKLIQLQTTIAKATNSVERKENQYTKMLQELRQNEPQQYKQKNLRQLYCWRLFFYIEDIKEIESLDQKFDPQKEYYLMVNLHNEITSFKLKDIEGKQNSSIKGLKVSYLFSENQKIDKFLNKSEILIRITYQNNWNSVVAEGSSNSLYEESQKFSMRKYKQILLFNAKSKYCVMGLHIGIKPDGKYCTQNLTLTKVYDAYLSNEKYINCLPIPPQWMEIIDPIYCVNKDRTRKFQYEMNMNPKQMRSLLPSIGNSTKKKLVL